MPDPDKAKAGRAGRVKDARGRSVTLIDPFLMHKLRQHGTIPADTLERIARDIGSGWAKHGVWLFSYIWSAALVLMVAAHFAKWGGGFSFHPRELRLLVVLTSLFVINCVIVWFFSRSGRLQRVCRILLGYCRCPHCGYDLRLLPADPRDGATVCPECGCAWKLEHTKRVKDGEGDGAVAVNEHQESAQNGDHHG
jgi:hypothetical protein